MHARNPCGINDVLSHLNGTPIQYKFLTNRVFSLALLFFLFLALLIIHLTDKTLTSRIHKISCSVTERSEAICIIMCSFQNNINAKSVQELIRKKFLFFQSMLTEMLTYALGL